MADNEEQENNHEHYYGSEIEEVLIEKNGNRYIKKISITLKDGKIMTFDPRIDSYNTGIFPSIYRSEAFIVKMKDK